jgi:phage terminase large subunit-like protein
MSTNTLTAEWSDFPSDVLRAIKSGPIPQDRDFSKIKWNDRTSAEKVMTFIETECKVPEGALVGKPIVLLPFQRAFIRAVYDNVDENNARLTRQAILSIARKNGKTSLVAPLTLASIIGPLAEKNAQIVSGAMSRDQASILFTAMSKMIGLNENMTKRTLVVPSGKRIKALTTNVEYKALSKDGVTAHGLSPNVAILDETGQVVGPRDSFIDAITTSQGAHTSPLLFVISTQAAADSDLLSIWIDDAQRNNDKTIVCHVYEADKNCDLLDETQWKYANPALGVFRAHDDLKRQLERAARMPAAEASSRNLLLNQRVSLLTLFVSPSVWKECSMPVNLKLFETEPVHLGLDLSSRNDLTACVASCRDPDTGIVHTLPFVFTPSDGLIERSQSDRAPYEQWAQDGHLIVLPGAHMNYDHIASALTERTHGWNISTLSFDRWRIEDFKIAADKTNFASEAEWIPCGQGFRDFSLRLEGLESLLLQRLLAHGSHPLLNMAAANAIVISDPSGNRKIDKSKASQRIDPLVALAMSTYKLSDAESVSADFDSMII